MIRQGSAQDATESSVGETAAHKLACLQWAAWGGGHPILLPGINAFVEFLSQECG